jgi:hypothetical protein
MREPGAQRLLETTVIRYEASRKTVSLEGRKQGKQHGIDRIGPGH